MSGGVDVLCRVGETEPRIVSLNLAGAGQVNVTISFPLEDSTVSLTFTAESFRAFAEQVQRFAATMPGNLHSLNPGAPGISPPPFAEENQSMSRVNKFTAETVVPPASGLSVRLFGGSDDEVQLLCVKTKKTFPQPRSNPYPQCPFCKKEYVQLWPVEAFARGLAVEPLTASGARPGPLGEIGVENEIHALFWRVAKVRKVSVHTDRLNFGHVEREICPVPDAPRSMLLLVFMRLLAEDPGQGVHVFGRVALSSSFAVGGFPSGCLQEGDAEKGRPLPLSVWLEFSDEDCAGCSRFAKGRVIQHRAAVSG